MSTGDSWKAEDSEEMISWYVLRKMKQILIRAIRPVFSYNSSD